MTELSSSSHGIAWRIVGYTIVKLIEAAVDIVNTVPSTLSLRQLGSSLIRYKKQADSRRYAGS